MKAIIRPSGETRELSIVQPRGGMSESRTTSLFIGALRNVRNAMPATKRLASKPAIRVQAQRRLPDLAGALLGGPKEPSLQMGAAILGAGSSGFRPREGKNGRLRSILEVLYFQARKNLLSTAPKESEGCILSDAGWPKMEIPDDSFSGLECLSPT